MQLTKAERPEKDSECKAGKPSRHARRNSIVQAQISGTADDCAVNINMDGMTLTLLAPSMQAIIAASSAPTVTAFIRRSPIRTLLKCCRAEESPAVENSCKKHR
jgi:hypothetical protein